MPIDEQGAGGALVGQEPAADGTATAAATAAIAIERPRRANVVSLRGAPIPLAGSAPVPAPSERPPLVPDPDVIEMCERLTELAKSGELRGLVFVAAHTGYRVAWSQALGLGIDPLAMLGGLAAAQNQLATLINEAVDS